MRRPRRAPRPRAGPCSVPRALPLAAQDDAVERAAARKATRARPGARVARGEDLLQRGPAHGRSAFIGLIVLFALSLPGIVAGSVFVESVFAWPGMGRVMLAAIAARDYPVVLGATAVYAAIVIASNLAADLVLPVVDPRRAR